MILPNKDTTVFGHRSATSWLAMEHSLKYRILVACSDVILHSLYIPMAFLLNIWLVTVITLTFKEEVFHLTEKKIRDKLLSDTVSVMKSQVRLMLLSCNEGMIMYFCVVISCLLSSTEDPYYHWTERVICGTIEEVDEVCLCMCACVRACTCVRVCGSYWGFQCSPLF